MSTASSANQNKQTQPQIQSFIETLRQKSIYDYPSSSNSAFESFTRKKEIEKQRLAEFHRNRLSEWHSVYSKKEQEKEKTIEEIRLQLKAIAKEIKQFDRNVAQAIFAPTPKAGVYHQTYLEHIKEVIEFLRHQVGEANSWISVYDKRQKSKGFYWQQAGKSGSSFMLNNERQIATSIG